jgi:hypothetical protein
MVCPGLLQPNIVLVSEICMRLFAFNANADPCSEYPDLLKVDAEALIDGLENGRWTSVDLVKVRISKRPAVNLISNVARLIHCGYKKFNLFSMP